MFKKYSDWQYARVPPEGEKPEKVLIKFVNFSQFPYHERSLILQRVRFIKAIHLQK